MQNTFTFIDLFAGIGGFHQALASLGGRCVFASEIDKYAIETYRLNYGMDAECDIRKVDAKEILKHDVLCAGFPCQSFSKAGKRLGFSDETKGTLFFEIERILAFHKTPYIILENVRNLVSHDKGNTWKVITSHLYELGYRLTKEPLILSPHQFGIPQLRERVIILGKYDPSHADEPLDIVFSDLKDKKDNSIHTILEKGKVDDSYYISDDTKRILSIWDAFYQGLTEKTIGFPVWVDSLTDTNPIDTSLPLWKQNFIRKNQELFHNNQKFLSIWLTENDNLQAFSATERKLEWQAGNSISSIWDGVIQFRPSGIRVKKPDCFPALVAMVQIPIIASLGRKLTVREAARLQSFPDSFIPNDNFTQAYKQFGNSVNVAVISECAKRLFASS